MTEIHYSIAVLIARIFLGVLFFIQGYDKVFKVKLANVIETFKTELGESKLPPSLIAVSAYLTSYVELIGGMCLILGFMKYFALYALGLDLILVSVAMGIINPVWKPDIVFPRLAVLLFLLIVPAGFDVFGLDNLFFG